jgi:hypothetical protein
MIMEELIKKTWFRWIAFIPGSLLAVLIAQFPIHWLVMLIHSLGKSDSDSGSGTALSLYYWLAKVEAEKLELLFSAFFTPLILITVVALIAPKYKLFLASICAVGLLVADLYIVMIDIANIDEGPNEDYEWIRLFVTLGLAVTGMTLGLIKSYKLQKQQTAN